MVSVMRLMVASKRAPSRSASAPRRLSIPLSGDHHMRRLRASRRACPSSIVGFSSGADHPREVDGGDAWGAVGPFGVARLVGELCDVAELLAAERSGVRGGRNTGQ